MAFYEFRFRTPAGSSSLFFKEGVLEHEPALLNALAPEASDLFLLEPNRRAISEGSFSKPATPEAG